MKFEEKHDVELKEIFKKDDILKEIVSFLNTQGGTIYLGINNKKEVIGLKGNLYVIQLQISDLLTDSISPRCIEYVHQHLEEIDNKPVIVIDIKADSTHLYYIKKYGLSENGVYIRSGSGCKSLTPEEIQNRYIAALNIPEPDITEIPSHRKILTFQILKNYLTTHNYHYTDSTFEENLHLRTKNGEYNLMAEILGDTNDIVINIATFATTDKTKYLKRNEFGGKCLLLAMEQAKDYIEAINQISVDTTIRPRLEKPMFDMNAFKEAWYNACVHYKWSDGQNPGIYIYSDRLVIESFGGMPKNLTKEQFLKGVSKPVNRKLFVIFKTCGFVEESGHGVPTVTKIYGNKAFEFDGEFIFVTIPFDRTGFTKETTKETTKEINNVVKETTKEKIISLLKANPSLTRDDLSQILKINKETIQYHLNKLKKAGKIIHVGSTKAGRWEIIKD